MSVLGRLPAARIPVSAFHVHAVVAYWSGLGELVPQEAEVAQVLRVPVSALVAPENRSSWRHSSGRAGPGFQVSDLYVWGFTAYVLDAVLEAGGWTVPWDQAALPRDPRHGSSRTSAPDPYRRDLSGLLGERSGVARGEVW